LISLIGVALMTIGMVVLGARVARAQPLLSWRRLLYYTLGLTGYLHRHLHRLGHDCGFRQLGYPRILFHGCRWLLMGVDGSLLMAVDDSLFMAVDGFSVASPVTGDGSCGGWLWVGACGLPWVSMGACGSGSTSPVVEPCWGIMPCAMSPSSALSSPEPSSMESLSSTMAGSSTPLLRRNSR
jgi:hypothetical protein